MSGRRERDPIVVSGATGFLGRNLVHRLRSTQTRVVPLVRTPDQAAKDSESILIADDNQTVSNIAALKPRAILHIAASGGVTSSTDEYSSIVRSNITLAALLMQSAVEAGDCRFLGIGSFSQRATMNGQIYPSSFYAASKNAAEALANYFCIAEGLEAIFLQLTDVYGKNDERRRLLTLLVDAVVTGVPIALTPGDQLVSFVHVEDVVDAILHGLQLEISGSGPHHFGVSGPHFASLRSTIESISEGLNIDIPVRWGERAYRRNEVLAPDLLDPPPGWQPKRPIVDGFQELLGARS